MLTTETGRIEGCERGKQERGQPDARGALRVTPQPQVARARARTGDTYGATRSKRTSQRVTGAPGNVGLGAQGVVTSRRFPSSL